VEELKTIKSDLTELRREIINYINSQESEQDLMDKFIAVKSKDEDVYELIMLIYQELKTYNKIHKKKLTNIIDKTIELKIKSLDTRINESKPTETLVDKVVNVRFISRIVALAMSVVAFLFVLYTINPTAFDGVKNSIIETVKVSKDSGDDKEEEKK
jgi:hypothetical protein